MKAYMGIDPGKTGAWAILDADGEVTLGDYDEDTARLYGDLRGACWEGDTSIILAALERVHAMPGQGVSSSFTFGENYGIWQGLLVALGVPWLTVTPQTWQKGIVAPKSGKDGSLQAARRLFPSVDLHRQKDHGKADALLIAYWASKQRG
jgi:hypothetical protein